MAQSPKQAVNPSLTLWSFEGGKVEVDSQENRILEVWIESCNTQSVNSGLEVNYFYLVLLSLYVYLTLVIVIGEEIKYILLILQSSLAIWRDPAQLVVD